MENVATAVKTLTEAKAPQTKAPQINTTSWADWFGLNLCEDLQVEKLVNTSAQWAKELKASTQPHWLVILGNSGVGKTHVANRLWKWLKTRPDFSEAGSYWPEKVYWPQFVEDMRSGNHYERFRDMMDWNYLYLDDVASERLSEFSTEKLHNLLGARVGKWTIITSNKGMKNIADLDPRIASRFIRDDAKIADVRTTDFNLRKFQKS